MKVMNNLKPFVLVCGLAFAVAFEPVFAFDDADIPKDDSIVMVNQAREGMEITDSFMMPTGTRVMDAAVGPIAFGVVYSDGQKQSGTSNWSSSYNSTYKRYEISINGESYYYLNYATVITSAGDVVYCRSSSVSGKLLVYCYDKSGNPTTARFGFATLKAN